MLVLFGGSETPPRSVDNICAIFAEKPLWRHSARRSFETWGVPEAVQMALIFQESSFRAKARPPRRRVFGIFPGARPSSAYGYAQALDGTWQEYRASTGRRLASRHDFDAAVDFIGWYGHKIHRRTGIFKDDAYRLYLAYHEGPAGFVRGSHKEKPWLPRVAEEVEDRARVYQSQYDRCQAAAGGHDTWRVWLLICVLVALAGGGYGWWAIRRGGI